MLAQRASNLSDAQVVGLDWKSRRFTPSRALPGLVWRGVWFPTMQGVVLLTAFVSDNAGVVLLTTFVSDNAGLFF